MTTLWWGTFCPRWLSLALCLSTFCSLWSRLWSRLCLRLRKPIFGVALWVLSIWVWVVKATWPAKQEVSPKIIQHPEETMIGHAIPIYTIHIQIGCGNSFTVSLLCFIQNCAIAVRVRTLLSANEKSNKYEEDCTKYTVHQCYCT